MSHLDSTHSRFHLRMSIAFLIVYIASAFLATHFSDTGWTPGVVAALIVALVATIRMAHHLGLLRDHGELDLQDAES